MEFIRKIRNIILSLYLNMALFLKLNLKTFKPLRN